jgi:hypothetical protein
MKNRLTIIKTDLKQKHERTFDVIQLLKNELALTSNLVLVILLSKVVFTKVAADPKRYFCITYLVYNLII